MIQLTRYNPNKIDTDNRLWLNPAIIATMSRVEGTNKKWEDGASVDVPYKYTVLTLTTVGNDNSGTVNEVYYVDETPEQIMELLK